MTLLASRARAALARRLAFALLAGGLAAGTQAQRATFTLVDKTNLTPGTYQIYVTGYSTNTPYVLQQDGSWAVNVAPSAGTATLPCYRFPQDITSVQVYQPAYSISARVYFFIVTDKTAFPACNPSGGGIGLFNVPSAFTYTDPASIAQPATALVSSLAFPAWTYAEVGASAASGTLDLSQVDFFAFPMGTTSVVSSGPATIGNPVGDTANPDTGVNHLTIRDSYRTWIDARARETSGKSCAEDSTPMACAYLDLLQDVTTPGSAVPQYVIQNPGGYLAQYTGASQASRLNAIFATPIAALWEAPTPPTLQIRTGGSLGGVPDDTFTSAIVTIPYPNASPPLNVRAMKFTGTAASGNYVAYVVDPNDYNTGCQSGQIASCINASSPGYQVFAGAGAFNTPTQTFYDTLLAGGYLSANAATYGLAGYQNVMARLGFLISGAMNRGVALANCGANDTWKCWQDETYWYPTATSATFPDVTQNLFSRWMHTASIGGTPMFVQPPSPLNAATGTPGTGATMGMAYGFSNDENPTPTVPSPPAVVSPQPEVPSKFDGTVVYGTAGTITFGPWVTAATDNATLAVTNAGGGTVTSTPGDIACGSTCSQAFARGSVVTLTATPAPGALFVRWENACTGTSTTCTVTLSESKTVVAVFGQVAGANQSLTVVVSGNGSVASAPGGIVCESTCSVPFTTGSVVTLTATPLAGSIFSGWSGACSGTAATCVVSLAQSRNVAAAFAPVGAAMLTVTPATGGSAVSAPAGIDCGVRCVASFAPGTAVNVSARPQPGYRFTGWSGACSGTGTCALTMNGSLALQASFAPVPAGTQALTVRGGAGGTVQSSPPGIECGTSCSATYPSATRVNLFAVPRVGYTFAGWSGACSGTGACTVFLDDSVVVDARFVANAVPVTNTAPIPTLSEWAMLVLATLMVLVAVPSLRTGRSRRGREPGRR